MNIFQRKHKNWSLFIIGVSTLLTVHSLNAFSDTPEKSNNLSISLKARSVVLGPYVKLGDVGNLIIPNNKTRIQIASVIIGKAPPPGEAREISLNYIKRCLKSSGFEEYISFLNGPKTVRVITAHVEIDKAFLQQEFAYVGQHKLWYSSIFLCF